MSGASHLPQLSTLEAKRNRKTALFFHKDMIAKDGNMPMNRELSSAPGRPHGRLDGYTYEVSRNCRCYVKPIKSFCSAKLRSSSS